MYRSVQKQFTGLNKETKSGDDIRNSSDAITDYITDTVNHGLVLFNDKDTLLLKWEISS
jgi:hypothetical protein